MNYEVVKILDNKNNEIGEDTIDNKMIRNALLEDWLLFDGDRLVAFVDGMVTDRADLTDEMYERADMHQEDGAWQMIFGVNTIPEYRRRGCAGMQ